MSGKEKARSVSGLVGEFNCLERDDDFLRIRPFLRFFFQLKNLSHLGMVNSYLAKKLHVIQFADEFGDNSLIRMGAFHLEPLRRYHRGVIFGDSAHLRLRVSQEPCAASRATMERFTDFATFGVNLGKPHDPLEFNTATHCAFMLVVIDALKCVSLRHVVHLPASGFVRSYVYSINQTFGFVNRQFEAV